MRTVQRSITSSKPPAELRHAVSTAFSAWANRTGYTSLAETPDSISYGKASFHTWQIVVAVFLFPIGLLGLLAEKQQSRIHALLMPGPRGTTVAVTASISGSTTGFEQAIDHLQRWAAAPAASLPPPPPPPAE